MAVGKGGEMSQMTDESNNESNGFPSMDMKKVASLPCVVKLVCAVTRLPWSLSRLKVIGAQNSA